MRVIESFPQSVDQLHLRILLMRELGRMAPHLNMAEVTAGEGNKKAIVTITIKKVEDRTLLAIEQMAHPNFADSLLIVYLAGILFFVMLGSYWVLLFPISFTFLYLLQKKNSPFSELQIRRAISNVKVEIG